MNPHVLSWSDLAGERSANGVAKHRLQGAGASLVRVAVPAGTTAGRHSHPFEQFVQVLSGTGVIETDQGQRAFGPGSLFHFPPDTWHAARFDEETVLVETNLGD